MPTHTVDIAILGAGTAGLTARRAAKAAGRSVRLVDPGPFGTTCARVGCMPSKLLIAAADAAHQASRTAPFGVHAGPVRIDGPSVLARVRAERDRFVGFVEEGIDAVEAAGELIRERARVVAPGLLDAGPHRVHFDRLIVATGSTPFVPPPYRDLPAERVLTNESIFELEDLPESLLVVGLGVVGLELGQALHRLGVRTTLLGLGGGVGPLTDPHLVQEALTHLGAELDLHEDHVLHAVNHDDHGVVVDFTDATGRRRCERFARVLLAAGRRSALGSLGLEAMGLQPAPDGRWPTDPRTLQLGDAPVWVAGDANGLHPLLHEAADDGRIAGALAAGAPTEAAAPRRTPLGIVFSDPQIAVVGRPHRQLAEGTFAIGAVDYGRQGRARVQRVDAGRVHVYAEVGSRRLLGAELFGPRMEHLAHLLAWAHQAGLTVDQALAMPFYHPVLEEGLRTALQDLARALDALHPAEAPSQGVAA